MREERAQIAGAQIIDDPVDLRGAIGGNVTVVEGGKLYVRGAIYGKLVIENGGRAHIYGHVQGDVTVEEGAKLIHSGVIGGDLVKVVLADGRELSGAIGLNFAPGANIPQVAPAAPPAAPAAPPAGSGAQQ